MAAQVLGSLQGEELQQLCALLRLLRAGSPELRALLVSTQSSSSRGSTTSPAAVNPGQSSQGGKRKGRWSAQKTKLEASGGRQDRTFVGGGELSTGSSWKTVKKAKTETSGSNVGGKDVLESEGWSVPVRACLADLNATTPGICLVSTAEAKRALGDLRGDEPMAILAPMNVNEEGTEMPVFVTDKNGRIQTRVRYLFQLGPEPVTFCSSAPQHSLRTDAVKVVVSIHCMYASQAVWSSAMRFGASTAKKWLLHQAAVEALDVRPPTRIAGHEDQLQMIAMVPKLSLDSVLKAGGADGVFTRSFFTSDEERAKFKIVPLEDGTTLDMAQGKAHWLGEIAFGIVTTRRGLAIRVKAGDYEQAVRRLHPEDTDRFLGSRWAVSGLPLATSKDALVAFLHPWRVSPEHTFRQGTRRTWIVRAQESPGVTKVQHEHGLAVIQEAQARPSAPSTRVERWQPPARGATSRAAPPPKTWAELVRGPPPTGKSQNSGRTAAAPRAEMSQQPLLGGESLPQAIAAAVASAMAPVMAQMNSMKQEIDELRSAEMEYIDDDLLDVDADLSSHGDSASATAASEAPAATVLRTAGPKRTIRIKRPAKKA